MRARFTFVALTALLATTLSACGSSSDTVVDKAKNDKKLVIGIKTDQPGLGLQTASGYTGFDVDVANYIAKKLGADKVEFKKTTSDVREQFIEQGDVDLVLATYSINDERKKRVSFAGPYLITGQDILVKADNTSITGLESLKDKTVCGAAGSNSPKRIAAKFGGSEDIANDWGKAHLKILNGYGLCLPDLAAGKVDAVSTDATILAGFAAQEPGKFKIVGQPFSTEKYGVGLKKDDKKSRDAINDAIEAMYKDGAWKAAIDKNFGEFGKLFTTPPPVERY
ncbi:glutamate ABC transporter substrate-binding protein [Actinocorallia longicatena]|uniref:Glutamate ABC transporter substrate-binding protein n=1 Tax=Actinocorallia longicatena TaxID=111803 RepID=A0ABP6QKI2_9ACTN